MDLSRRSLTLAPLLMIAHRAVAAPPVRGVPPNGRLMFNVVRKGDIIGKHNLGFAESNGRLVVTINIETAVKVGPITVFRYEMNGTETWEGGRFTALNTISNDDGDHHTLAIRRTGEQLLIESSGLATRTESARASPLTHWSAASLSGPLISPQDGRLMPGRVTPLGPSTVQGADGRTIQVTGFDLAIKTPTEDWYDSNGIWAGLRLHIQDGSIVDYQRMA